MIKSLHLHVQLMILGLLISFITFVSICAMIEYNLIAFSKELYSDLNTQVNQTLEDSVLNESKRIGNLAESHSYWTDLLEKTEEKDNLWISLNATHYMIKDPSYNVDSFYLINDRNGYETFDSDLPKAIFEEIVQLHQADPIKSSYVGYLVVYNGQQYILDISALADSDGLNPSGHYILGHRVDEDLQKEIQYLHGTKGNIEVEIGTSKSISAIPKEEKAVRALIQKNFQTTITDSTVLSKIRAFRVQLIQFIGLVIVLCIVIFLSVLQVISVNMKKSVQSIQYLSYHDFTKKIDLNFSKEFTDLSLCINALSSELEKRDHDINQKYVEIITILIAALEAVDVYTKGHSERVSHYSVELAKAIQYADVEAIRLSGLLHDIGKISVDTKILNKPSGLTAPEFEEIKKHPVTSFQILEVSDIFKDVKHIVKFHHEKMDGTGYPEGLSGAEIPLGARIVAIADVFDSLTSKRSYREAMTVQDALQIIENSSGTHFDAALVPVFLSIAHSVYTSWSDLENAPLAVEIMPLVEAKI